MERTSRFAPSRYTGLVIFFLGLFATPMAAQNLYQISPSEIHYWEGQRFTLHIDTDIPSIEGVEVAQQSWPDQITLTGGPRVRMSEWVENGQEIQGARISFDFLVRTAGVSQGGPLRILHPDGLMVITPFPMVFVLWDERTKAYPLETAWDIPLGPFYVGSPVLAQLMILNLENVEIPFGNDLSSPSGAILEKVPELGGVKSNPYFNDTLHQIPWGTWLLTPTRDGTISLPRPRVTYDGVTRLPPTTTIDVLDIPPEVASTRAVGDFDYRVWTEQSTLAAGENLIVYQSLEGTGNFPYLDMPEITIPGMSGIQMLRNETYTPSEAGYQGIIINEYTFSAEVSGNRTFRAPEMVWFNPRTSRVVRETAAILSFDITDRPVEIESREVPELLSWPQILSAQSWNLIANPMSYLALLPGVLFFIGFLLYGRISKKTLMVSLVSLGMSMALVPTPEPPEFNLAMENHLAGDLEGAKNLWGELYGQTKLPGFLYNEALASFELNEHIEASRLLINAWRNGMRTSVLKNLYGLSQEDLGVDSGVNPLAGFNEDPWFFLFVLLINTGFVLLAFYFRSRNLSVMVTVVLVSLSGMGTLALVGNSFFENQNPLVITLSDQELRRVPSLEAEGWIPLGAGTSLYVLGEYEDFVLVRNGNGVKGWMVEDSLVSISPHR